MGKTYLVRSLNTPIAGMRTVMVWNCLLKNMRSFSFSLSWKWKQPERPDSTQLRLFASNRRLIGQICWDHTCWMIRKWMAMPVFYIRRWRKMYVADKCRYSKFTNICLRPLHPGIYRRNRLAWTLFIRWYKISRVWILPVWWIGFRMINVVGG